jgi:tetratricopeptide (TPR) repeat protein
LRALEHLRFAFERMPDKRGYRRQLGDQYRNLARVERALGRPAAAAAASRECAELWPNNPDQLYGVAHDLALCVPMVGTDEQKQYADEALDVLRRAVAAGFRDASRMSKQAGFAPLRGRDDFAALLRDLERAAPPAQRPADRPPEPTKPATDPVPGPSAGLAPGLEGPRARPSS